MEKYLITMTVYERIEADPNAIIRALVQLREGKGRLILLGRKGSMHAMPDEHKYTHEQLHKAAQEGLLYTEGKKAIAFAPDLDAATGLPLLMDEYQEAFRRRQLDNSPKEEQLRMKLETPAQ